MNIFALGGYYLISMMFIFQIEVAPGSWLKVGSAEGHGVHATGGAIHELMMANGGTLKEGKYRYRPLYGGTQEWSHLTLSSTGHPNPES
ncbi:MAG TPA: hypothetical protein VNS60_06070 [Solirubrobacterales bacterium]|nr:hypothetical protein [Solirubrobacterales bacterium]